MYQPTTSAQHNSQIAASRICPSLTTAENRASIQSTKICILENSASLGFWVIRYPAGELRNHETSVLSIVASRTIVSPLYFIDLNPIPGYR